MGVGETLDHEPKFRLISSTMVSMKCIVEAKQRWSEHELTSFCTGGLNVDDLIARPDLAMRYNHPNEDVPVSANAPPPVPFYPPAASNNGPGVASPLASRPVSYQNQQVAGQNQPVSPLRPWEEFDSLRANPAASAHAGNTAPGQLPTQFPGYNMVDNDGDEPMLDFDFDVAAFDQGLGAFGFDLTGNVVDAGRAPTSPFPLRGPRWLPANDSGVFRPNAQNGTVAAYADLFPRINTKELAVAEIPSGAIGVPSQPMANFCMEGRQWQNECVRVAKMVSAQTGDMFGVLALSPSLSLSLRHPSSASRTMNRPSDK